MMKDKESLYPYYFKSMSYFDEVTKSFKLKQTFNLVINFYQRKKNKEKR